MTDTATMIFSNDFDSDKLVEANLDIGTKEMYLILTGSSLAEWLETANAVTGLYPFMSMAKSSTYNLGDVYDATMVNLNNILERKLRPRHVKHSGTKCTRDRNSKRLKRV